MANAKTKIDDSNIQRLLAKHHRRAWWKVRLINNAFAALFIGMFIGYPFALLMDRTAPFIIQKTEVIGGVVHSDKSFTIKTTGIKTRGSCHGIVDRDIVDSSGVIHRYDKSPSSFYGAASGTGPQVFERDFIAPKNLALGKGYYVIHVEWYCNFMQEFFWTIPVDAQAEITIE